MKHETGLGWTPRDGDLVQLAARNRFDLPAGRYRLLRLPASARCNTPERWRLEGIASDATQDLSGAMLAAMECAASLQPVGSGQLEREAEELRLRLHAPLMGLRSGAYKAQHDASDLALFRAADEPGLAL